MEPEIIVAVIGLIEAILITLLPIIISKFSAIKSIALAKEKILPHHTKTSKDKEIDSEID